MKWARIHSKYYSNSFYVSKNLEDASMNVRFFSEELLHLPTPFRRLCLTLCTESFRELQSLMQSQTKSSFLKSKIRHGAGKILRLISGKPLLVLLKQLLSLRKLALTLPCLMISLNLSLTILLGKIMVSQTGSRRSD